MPITGSHTTYGSPTLGDSRTPTYGRDHFAQSQVPHPSDARLVQVRTEALWGPTSANVVALLDSAVPTPSGGGGIEVVPRPGRRPLTPYRSPEVNGLTLSFVLDGHAKGESVEADCRGVEIMAGQFVSGDTGPQRLIVVGKAVPHCKPSQAFKHRWLILGEPSWGDDPSVIRRHDGHRIRQQVSLTLVLATDVDELERIPPRQSRPNHRTIHAKKGDTYLKIARRELGSERYGRRLAKLNDAHDPHKTLHEGAKVRLPSQHLLAEWKRDLKIKG